jgi:hypothetical protein
VPDRPIKNDRTEQASDKPRGGGTEGLGTFTQGTNKKYAANSSSKGAPNHLSVFAIVLSDLCEYSAKQCAGQRGNPPANTRTFHGTYHGSLGG